MTLGGPDVSGTVLLGNDAERHTCFDLFDDVSHDSWHCRHRGNASHLEGRVAQLCQDARKHPVDIDRKRLS